MQPGDSAYAWRLPSRTTLQALTLWDKAQNNVGPSRRRRTNQGPVAAARIPQMAPRWQARNNEADVEQDRCPVEFKMCLLPVVFTCLANMHVSAASVVSLGHPSYRGQIIMQSTGSFMPGASGTACTTTKGCYCIFYYCFFLLGFHNA